LIDLNDLVQISNDLEPLPVSATRLANLVSQPNSDINEIVDIISLDQVLTVNVLRSANSALSNPVSKITTVKDAVVRLGTGTVLAMAVGSNIKGRMKDSPLENIGLSEERIWSHSVATALASECIKKVVKENIPPETFTAALLHDIGKLILCRYLEKDIQKEILDEIERNGSHPTEAEFDILGCDHAELGSIIARQWELPESIIHGIAWHHSPEDFIPEVGETAIVPFVIALSDGIAKAIGAGLADNEPLMKEHVDAMKFLKIDEELLKKICVETKRKLKLVGDFYG
jgi:putative nucleotidyltransferase with HDIG domain